MKFKEYYTNESDKLKDENKDKTVLSNDAYALGELLDELNEKITRFF